MKITNFRTKVYQIAKKIPRGRVSTYREIAKKLKTKAYRAVGTAMNKNPYAPEVPCHRVVNSDGRLGGFASGTRNKIKMLEKEGIKIKDGKIENFERVLYKF